MISTNGDKTPVFVENNVFVYSVDAKNPDKARIAEALINELTESERIRISTQVLQELYNTITRKLKQSYTPADALAIIESLSNLPVVTIDYSMIRRAAVLSQESQISFWDGLIVVAAAKSGAKVVYSEDLNNGQTYLGVTVCNPFPPSEMLH